MQENHIESRSHKVWSSTLPPSGSLHTLQPPIIDLRATPASTKRSRSIYFISSNQSRFGHVTNVMLAFQLHKCFLQQLFWSADSVIYRLEIKNKDWVVGHIDRLHSGNIQLNVPLSPFAQFYIKYLFDLSICSLVPAVSQAWTPGHPISVFVELIHPHDFWRAVWFLGCVLLRG